MVVVVVVVVGGCVVGDVFCRVCCVVRVCVVLRCGVVVDISFVFCVKICCGKLFSVFLRDSLLL